MFNMNVFWVLFLVLSHTIGNQGYSENGHDKDKFPQYIVSIRNEENCHYCTGSIISESWILSSIICWGASHVLYGLSKFENCNEIQEDQYRNNITDTQYSVKFAILLYKVQNNFDVNLKKLGLPTPSCCYFEKHKGTAIGWSLENDEKDCVMKKIHDVNLKKAFTEKSTLFDEIGCGSPLVVKHNIVGIFSYQEKHFISIFQGLVWIKETITEKDMTIRP